jgi:hypothetical protein
MLAFTGSDLTRVAVFAEDLTGGIYAGADVSRVDWSGKRLEGSISPKPTLRRRRFATRRLRMPTWCRRD